MTVLDIAIEELKSLPKEKMETAAEYIHRLREPSRTNRNAILDATAGSLEGEIGESFAKAIEEGCERIDANGW